MKPENRAYLEQQQGLWSYYKRNHAFLNFDNVVCKELIRIAREEFAANFVGNCGCGPCKADVLTYVYTQFDKLPAIEPQTPTNERKATKARTTKQEAA